MDKFWCLYILKCCDGSYYTGITNQLEKRMDAHQMGKGSKYVASRRPFELVYQERLSSRSEALKREHAIKKLSRTQKEALINP